MNHLRSFGSCAATTTTATTVAKAAKQTEQLGKAFGNVGHRFE